MLLHDFPLLSFKIFIGLLLGLFIRSLGTSSLCRRASTEPGESISKSRFLSASLSPRAKSSESIS